MANQRWALARSTAVRQYDSNRRGYFKRSAEVTAERAVVREPTWWVEAKEPGDYFLYNGGYAVSDVRLDAPEAEFIFEGPPPIFVGKFGDDSHGGATGKFFGGQPTDRGDCPRFG